MPLYDDYEEWKSAMRVQIMSGIIAEMTVAYHKNHKKLPPEDTMNMIGDVAAEAAEIWERTTAP
jgi:hypothetical protein